LETLQTYRRALPREEINALPIWRYEGPIHLIQSQDAAATAIAGLAGQAVLGFDTETRPAFHKGQHFRPALLQLASTEAVYLFPIARLGLTDAMLRLFTDATVLKAGVALRDDLKELQAMTPFEPAGFVDLGVLAHQAGLPTCGLRTLAANLLGIRISKKAQRSNWAVPQLTPQQITYAATDAWISRELYLKLVALGAGRAP